MDSKLDEMLRAMVPVALQRQPDERLPAYQQFLAYLRLGPHRGYTKLAKQLGLNVRTVERLAASHRWHARAKALDDLLANDALCAVLRATLADAEPKAA